MEGQVPTFSQEEGSVLGQDILPRCGQSAMLRRGVRFQELIFMHEFQYYVHLDPFLTRLLVLKKNSLSHLREASFHEVD